LIHAQGLQFLSEVLPQTRQPFATPPEWSVLAEVGLPVGQPAQSALERLFEVAAEQGLVTDGVIAQSQAQRRDLWTVRETIPEANRLIGAISSHDISLPLGEISAFITRAGAMIGAMGDFRINCFGHLGDGNLHYNVFPQRGAVQGKNAALQGMIAAAVHDLVHEMGGSFSAEHGVGRMKVADLARYGDPVRLDAMRAIKTALDPVGIMNPGAVLA
jgi:FAD/FMN-containing dehydrogenase